MTLRSLSQATCLSYTIEALQCLFYAKPQTGKL